MRASNFRQRPLPPFGRQLPFGSAPVFVSTGNKPWKRASLRRSQGDSVLVLPSDHCPTAYTWPVLDRYVCVTDQGSGDDELRRLAITLLQAGARVVCIDREGAEFVIFRPRDDRDAA